MKEIMYKDAEKWMKKEFLHEDFPNVPQDLRALSLEQELMLVRDQEAKIQKERKDLEDRLKEVCLHPLNARMIKRWSITDTLGNGCETYQDLYCTSCGQCIVRS